jgi:hypothetical protein
MINCSLCSLLLIGSCALQALPRLLSSCCNAEEPITADIKILNRKLQVILKEKHKLQLRPSFSDRRNTPVRTAQWHRKSQQGTRAPDSDIVGARIEDDADELLGRLTVADGQTNCTIVAIVGPDARPRWRERCTAARGYDAASSRGHGCASPGGTPRPACSRRSLPLLADTRRAARAWPISRGR